MIKELFKDYSFTFNEWIRIYTTDAWLNKVFKDEYKYMNNKNKINLILKGANLNIF